MLKLDQSLECFQHSLDLIRRSKLEAKRRIFYLRKQKQEKLKFYDEILSDNLSRRAQSVQSDFI